MSLHWKNEPLVIEVQNYHIQLFAGLPDSQVLDLWLRLVVQILMVSGWICPGKQFWEKTREEMARKTHLKLFFVGEKEMEKCKCPTLLEMVIFVGTRF